MNKKPSFGRRTTERREVGALWRKKDKHGREYYSAKFKLEGKEINVRFFQNRSKKHEMEPDFKAYDD